MTIELPYIQKPEDFPAVSKALDEPNGLLGFGQVLSVELLLSAYRRGIFPWFNPGEPVFWWSPDPRAAFFPEITKPSKSLHKKLKKRQFQVTLNKAFHQVIAQCAERQPNRPETWITQEMQIAYGQLHEAGYAHSIEVWLNEQLVGGLYGVSLGKLFFGESMFHRATDASKIALFYLMAHCRSADFPIIDCQLPNSHLMSLGAKQVSREDFLGYLYNYRDAEIDIDFWQPKVLSTLYRF